MGGGGEFENVKGQNGGTKVGTLNCEAMEWHVDGGSHGLCIGSVLQKQDQNKKEIVVLGPKRSNAINIGMTVLPPPRTIKTGILKMDTSIINREGLDVSHCYHSVGCFSGGPRNPNAVESAHS